MCILKMCFEAAIESSTYRLYGGEGVRYPKPRLYMVAMVLLRRVNCRHDCGVVVIFSKELPACYLLHFLPFPG